MSVKHTGELEVRAVELVMLKPVRTPRAGLNPDPPINEPVLMAR